MKAAPRCRELKVLPPDVYELVSQLRAPGESPLLPSLAGRLICVAYLKSQRDIAYLALRNIDSARFVDAFLSGHLETNDKHTNAVVFSDLYDYRTDDYVRAVYAFVFDLDNTMSFDEVVALLRTSGLTAIVYSTFSHGKSETLIEVGKYEEWARSVGRPTTAAEESLEVYLAARKKHLANVNSVEAVNGEDGGRYYRISHAPTHSTRAIVFVTDAVEIIGDGGVGLDGFKALYRAVAIRLFGSNALELVDLSCANAGSLFYLPAKPTGQDRGHQIVHLNGQLLDWKPIWNSLRHEIVARRERITVSRATAPPGLDDIKQCLLWIPACDYQTWITVIAAIHNLTDGDDDGYELADWWSQTCPDAYEDDAVEKLWSSYDSTNYSGAKAGMGTLVHLARQHCPGFYISR